MRTVRRVMLTATLLLSSIALTSAADAADESLETDVRAAILNAARYFTSDVALQGGYVYYYSPDLKKRLGEGVATSTQIWVQPPGTPTVGLALLEAYQATGEPFLLNAATAAAEALIYGQLKSGAWTNSIDFNPRGQTAEYRNGKGQGRNFSTLDDGISQAAMQLLMQVDQAHEFNDSRIHEAAQTALNAFLAAQYSNGAFPQGWDEQPMAAEQPVQRGAFPGYDWRTEGRVKEYWDMYTLNDGAAGTTAATLIMAHEIYGTDRYRESLLKLGEFLILAQMPQPQPAWAQQYSYQMHPIWARRFEPPAIAGRESQDVIRTLIRISAYTGDKRFLAPIPAALDYLQASVLPDGRICRYYELQTNRPLYMQRTGREYALTYDDSRLPSHYGWKVENQLAELQQQYERLSSDHSLTAAEAVPTATKVRELVAALDGQSRWISRFAGEALSGQPKFRPGEDYLSSEIFSRNIQTLSVWIRNQNP